MNAFSRDHNIPLNIHSTTRVDSSFSAVLLHISSAINYRFPLRGIPTQRRNASTKIHLQPALVVHGVPHAIHPIRPKRALPVRRPTFSLPVNCVTLYHWIFYNHFVARGGQQLKLYPATKVYSNLAYLYIYDIARIAKKPRNAHKSLGVVFFVTKET